MLETRSKVTLEQKMYIRSKRSYDWKLHMVEILIRSNAQKVENIFSYTTEDELNGRKRVMRVLF